jgi:hypothetical protein
MSINKKCPPGVICVENITMFFILVVVFIVIYLIYVSLKPISVNNNHKIVIRERQDERNYNSGGLGGVGGGLGTGFFGLFSRPSYSYSNLPGDVLMNPYVPPLRDERYLVPELAMVPPGRVPINISTNPGAVDTAYRQMGILTPLNRSSADKILPLMGRPLFTNRDKWQYYTMSDQNNSVKLPIRFKGRNASNEYGVDKIYNGDVVYVEGYQKAFKVTEYENDTIKYLPFI